MKKIKLLFVAIGLMMAIASSGIGTGLSFRMSNPKILYYSSFGNYLSFDIEVMAASPGSFLFSGQANISFNNSVISPTAADWSVAHKGTLLSGTYDMTTPPFTSGATRYPVFVGNFNSGNYNVVWGANSDLVSKEANSTYFNEVSTSWQPIATVTVKILDPNAGLAGISFVPASMDNQEFYQQAANTLANYSVAYSTDMSNLYVGRIFAAAYGWTQTGGGTAWTTALNTSIWDGTATLPLPAITGFPANASAVRIHSGATLTVPPTGQLTTASIENNTANGLTIQSDGTGTGSLITGTVSGAGTAVVQRYMSTGAWHQVSPPLAGQSIGNFLTTNGNVATKNTTERAMINYVTSSNAWSPSYTNSTLGDLAAGQGYMMRTGTDAAVNFTGSIKTTSASVTLSGAGATGWNLIGNPFTSAINSNTGTSSFLVTNAASLDGNSLGLYVWNQGTSVYDVVNYSTGADIAALGQAFFVKSASDGASVSFAPGTAGMQVHSSTGLKSAKSSYPEIKLIAINDNQNASTIIKFISGTSKGLDPGYDAGLFSLGSSVSLYTKLVEDNGVNFMLQCLPNTDFSGMIIPVGIDSKAGGEVVFSSDLMNLPGDCKVILEDKLVKTFTDLSKNVYKTTLAANSTVADRFQIHTSYQTTGLSEDYFNGKLSAYAIRNIEIRIKGDVTNHAIATLYDVQGRSIISRTLEGGSLNVLRTPNIKTGIYMLFVKDNDKIQGFKIPVNE